MNTKERLKFIRDHLGGISQQKLADELGCKKTTIASIETGTQKNPPYDLALMLNEKYGFAVRWFMKGDEPKFDMAKSTLRRTNKDYSQLTNAINYWGKRLEFIQKENNFTNEEFANLLNMKLDRFLSICLHSKEPTLKELINIKSNFDIQIDDLLFDEDNIFFEDKNCCVIKDTTEIKLSAEEVLKLKKLLSDK